MAASPDLRPGATAEEMRPVSFAVRENVRETGDTFTLLLDRADGGEGWAFAPGQFNMVYLFGAGEVPISISGDPARPEVLSHTIRAVGTVTRGLQRLGRGDVVGVRGPFGTPWPVEAAKGQDLVLVAGGIGLAPLRPALHHVLLHRSLYGRVALLYGARTPRDLLFAKELRGWRGRFDLEVEVTVDRADPAWQGGVGVVTKLIERCPIDPANASAFVCGPEVMIRFTAMGLEQRGLADESIFVSVERNMKCGVGLCGHCQFGPFFACREGPVLSYDAVRGLFGVREV